VTAPGTRGASPEQTPARSPWPPLRASLVVVGVLATVGTFMVGFGVLTGCTSEYSCTATGCPPETGRVVGQGGVADIQDAEMLQKAFLGGTHDDAARP
jgi:hypothetical protein